MLSNASNLFSKNSLIAMLTFVISANSLPLIEALYLINPFPITLSCNPTYEHVLFIMYSGVSKFSNSFWAFMPTDSSFRSALCTNFPASIGIVSFCIKIILINLSVDSLMSIELSYTAFCLYVIYLNSIPSLDVPIIIFSIFPVLMFI